jgi:Pvc16 N-terminal domain
LSFQGNDVELEPERLLGSVVRALHARPVLTGPVIQRVTQAGTILAGSNLAEGPELVKFTPLPLTLEELSKLWSVLFQTPYSLSIAYQGSVVLIDGAEAPEPAPPVREPVVSVEPFEVPS